MTMIAEHTRTFTSFYPFDFYLSDQKLNQRLYQKTVKRKYYAVYSVRKKYIW